MNESLSLASPYKGLTYYTEQDAGLFFGRTQERGIIAANLLSKRLTLLYGPSGVGKSSVLRAGVVNYLRELGRHNFDRRGCPELTVVVFNDWRDDPLPSLAAQICEAVSSAVGGEPPEPRPAPDYFPEFLEACSNRVGGSVLIILDQFEEYFLYHSNDVDEQQTATFANELARALSDPSLRTNFLVSIREDAYTKLDRFEGRIPGLFENYVRLEHLDRNAARSAIEKPVEKYNERLPAEGPLIGIEPGLTDAILDQVEAGRIVLGETGHGSLNRDADEAQIEAPFLQLVMTRLWQEEMKAGSAVLRLATLERLGGAERIVQTHLDEVMSGLVNVERDIAASVFRFLVTPSGTKIAHTVPDLAKYGDLELERLAPVLKKLSSSDVCILRPVPPPPDHPGTMRYEIFHDVLAPAILGYAERAHAAKEAAERARKRTRLLVFGALSVLTVIAIAVAFYANSLRKIAVTSEQRAVEAASAEQLAIKRERDTNNTVIPDIYDLLYDVSNFDQTLARFEETLEFKRRQGDPRGVGITLANIGQLYYRAGQYGKAEDEYRQALKILETELPGHSYLGATFNGLAAVCLTQGKYDEAAKLFERGREILQKNLGNESKDVVVSLTGLADVAEQQGKYSEAEQLLVQALEASRKIYGEPHQQVALSESALGALYLVWGKNSESIKLYEQSLKTFESTVGKSNPNDPVIAQVLVNLSVLYTKVGRYSDANTQLSRVKQMQGKNPSLSPLEIAGYESAYGYLLAESGKYSQAVAPLNRALALYKGAFGSDHPVVANSSNSVAMAYRKLGRCPEAETLLDHALKVQEAALGTEHPDMALTLSNLADCYRDQKRYIDAESLYNRALKIRTEKLGPDHADLVPTIEGLGSLYTEQGRYDDAERLFKRALSIAEKTLGTDHPKLALTLEEYANLLRRTGRNEEARSTEERAKTIRSTHLRKNLT
jgi:tetratricopeptide (TPR) repeat protein